MRRVAFLAALVVISACGAATGSPGPDMVVDCDAFAADPAPGRELGVAVGTEFTVTLCSNPSTGFSWEEPTWEGDQTVELVRAEGGAPAASGVGAAGTETFAFQAIASGQTTVRFVYSQPWAGGTKGAWRLDLSVAATD
jgi:predicted secreted protein